MNKIEEYYNKFNEEKRLNSRHGQIEYRITMKYIHDYLDVRMQELKVANRKISGFLISVPEPDVTAWHSVRKAMM